MAIHKIQKTKKALILSLCALGIGSTLALAGCSSAPQNPVQKPSGFLPDYSLLKQVPNTPQGMQVYTYSSPDFTPAYYHAVIVNPVTLYQTATENGITDQQIQAAQDQISQGIQQLVSRKAAIVTTPGPGVVSLTVAITGAQIESEGFKPWNVIPISAAIKLASMATNTDSKTPVMVVEIKMVDSQTGKLLRETVSMISGDQFRTTDTSQEFEALAQSWVQQALKYSSTQNS